MIRIPAILALVLAAGPAAAVALDLPGSARQTARVTEDAARIALPTGPWDGATVPIRIVEGAVTRTAWRLGGESRTTAQIAAPLRRQLGSDYRIVFECSGESCGGFDFRFATETPDAPQMYVDLGDFLYLLAERPDGSDPLSLVISRDSDAGFVQITRVDEDAANVAEDAPPAAETPPAEDAPPAAEGTGEDLWAALRRLGRAPLDDLDFSTGSAALGEGEFASLQALAEGLARDPSARLTLVGHSDAQGPLDTNVALSRRRADAVRQRLIERHGIAPERLGAEGVGFLAPRASNATAEGRLVNRRVEAVLTR